MNIVTIVGARPQFIKAAAVSCALARSNRFHEHILHTGQHYDEEMSRVFFDELQIPAPVYHLGIGSALHGAQTGRMLERIEHVLLEHKPDLVLVYGDTNSTLSGALAAVKLHIRVAHVEAGLRSYNRRMPEEINRIVTDHVSDLLFAPTDTAVRNLLNEDISEDRVHQVGDVMFDVALSYGYRADATSSILERQGLEKRNYVLATVHRAENTDDSRRMRSIIQALWHVAADLPVIIPTHPRTAGVLRDTPELSDCLERLMIVDPVSYLDMAKLEKHAAVVVTDSGGVQKEAFFYNVPCVTLRDETEWVELVDLGWNILAPPVDADALADAIRRAVGSRGVSGQPYGHGDAAFRIARILEACS